MSKSIRLLMIFAAAVAAPVAASAQSYPTKPVSIVVPFTAAGPSDVMGRLLAKSMANSLGQPVNVENIAGAGGATGSARVAKAAPDGHTLLLHHFAHAASPAIYPNLAFDPVKDFEPIGLVSYGPYMLVARTSLPVKNAAEALKYIRDNKEKVTLGHAGLGSGSHLTNIMLRSALGKVKVTEKGYRGTGPAMTDLAAGQIDFLMDQSVNVVPQVKQGTIRVLAVTSSTRMAAFKDVPTLQEAGLKGFEVTQWFALYAPKGTPKPVLDKLSAALEKTLQEKETIDQINALGSEVFPVGKRGPVDARKRLEAEVVRWQKVIKDSGVDFKEAK